MTYAIRQAIAHDRAPAPRVSSGLCVVSRGLEDPRAVQLFEASRPLSLKGALG